MKNDFLKDENLTLVLPEIEKPLKIVYEDRYKIEATDNPMEFIFTMKTTIGEAASSMNMSIEEFLEWVGKIH